MVILQTPRLLLREWTDDDLQAALPIYTDPEVMKHVFPFRPLSERRLKLDIEKFRADYKSRGWSRWAVVLSESVEIIGHCGFDLLEHTGNIEFQLLLARQHWGRGLGQEIARETIKHGFDVLGFEQIIAVTPPNNPRGVNLLERLSMSFLGEDFYYGQSMCCYVMDKK